MVNPDLVLMPGLAMIRVNTHLLIHLLPLQQDLLKLSHITLGVHLILGLSSTSLTTISLRSRTQLERLTKL
jgi:hypothetical protein